MRLFRPFFALALVALFATPLAVAPAAARDAGRVSTSAFECGWRALPSSVRVAMTENLRSPEDMRNLGERLSGLSDEDLLAAGRRCQFDVAAQAERFGGFMAARAIVVALGARLQIEFGVHDGQLDAFVEALGPRLRAEVAANMMAGLAPGKDAMDALLAAIDRSGVAPDPIELRSLAAGYAVSRVAMEELAR
jgi:hypothetical protein